jgi:hypothetical protein
VAGGCAPTHGRLPSDSGAGVQPAAGVDSDGPSGCLPKGCVGGCSLIGAKATRCLQVRAVDNWLLTHSLVDG